MYVTAIDPATATVTLGPREALMRSHLSASRAVWQQPVGESFRAAVQIRYAHRAAAATVRRTGADRFEVDFDRCVSAVTPGQAAVVYDGDVVLGGGMDRLMRRGDESTQQGAEGGEESWPCIRGRWAT